MKESYEIILKKLEKDATSFEREIKDIIDKVDYNELYKMRYERLTGAKNYCKDLIEFFTEVKDHLN